MRWVKVIAVILIILTGGYFAIPHLVDDMRLGLDLQGGVHVVLLAEHPEGEPVTPEDMEQLTSVMRERVDELGVAEPIIQREGDDRLIVELPGVDDPQEAIDTIGKTAYLEFKTADEETILTGAQLADAKAVMQPETNNPIINIQFDREGSQIFADVTRELTQMYPENDPRRSIGIYLDGNMLTNPTVREQIPDGQAQISGGFQSFEEAADLAALLRAGALPVDVQIIENRTVGPTLGEESLQKSIQALAFGIAGIMIFMIAFYRVPGVIANFALVAYGLLLASGLVAINATITLFSIAGLLLSIGMAVDTNIIIFERIKEELRSGKTLRAGVDAGFRRAMLTVLDANITTLVVTAVLFYFGTGPIRGFALTLSIGILASLVTAIVLTRFILREVANTGTIRNPKSFGA